MTTDGFVFDLEADLAGLWDRCIGSGGAGR